MESSAFDYFIALDGPGLDGIKRGFAGIARLRCRIVGGRFEHDAPMVQFYDGLACGHATQINKEGTLGFLGNTSGQMLFYNPRTLTELKRFSTLRLDLPAPKDIQEGQTHALWLSEKVFISAVGPYFYEFNITDLEHPRRLGEHLVRLPHAIKLSPSKRWLCYGSMDSNDGWARQVGFFDLERRQATVLDLKETVWHLGVHPTEDIFYAPTQCVDPQPGLGRPFDFEEWLIGYRTEYLHRFHIDKNGTIHESHRAFPPSLPHHLTSDVVAVGDERETVLYNCCASATIVGVEFATGSSNRYVNEWTSPLSWEYGAAGRANALDGFIRTSVLSNSHALLKALLATRFSAVDGSYGLALSPDKKFLLSAHRGRNEVLVYSYPELALVQTVKFPSFQQVIPDAARWLETPYLRHLVGKDYRLGFHHSVLTTAL